MKPLNQRGLQSYCITWIKALFNFSDISQVTTLLQVTVCSKTLNPWELTTWQHFLIKSSLGSAQTLNHWLFPKQELQRENNLKIQNNCAAAWL